MRALVILSVLLLASFAEAHVTPSNPSEFTKRGLSDSGSSGTASVGVTAKPPKVLTITYTAVSPVRGWTNTDGKTIQAQLLAFSAPEPGQPGAVEIIREGKFRLLVPGSRGPVEYPMEKLQEEDKIEIERIAKAAAKGLPGAPSQSEKSEEKE